MASWEASNYTIHVLQRPWPYWKPMRRQMFRLLSLPMNLPQNRHFVLLHRQLCLPRHLFSLPQVYLHLLCQVSIHRSVLSQLLVLNRPLIQVLLHLPVLQVCLPHHLRYQPHQRLIQHAGLQIGQQTNRQTNQRRNRSVFHLPSVYVFTGKREIFGKMNHGKGGSVWHVLTVPMYSMRTVMSSTIVRRT